MSVHQEPKPRFIKLQGFNKGIILSFGLSFYSSHLILVAAYYCLMIGNCISWDKNYKVTLFPLDKDNGSLNNRPFFPPFSSKYTQSEFGMAGLQLSMI